MYNYKLYRYNLYHVYSWTCTLSEKKVQHCIFHHWGNGYMTGLNLLLINTFHVKTIKGYSSIDQVWHSPILTVFWKKWVEHSLLNQLAIQPMSQWHNKIQCGMFFLRECICINYMCIIYAVCTAQSMCLYLLYSNQYYYQLWILLSIRSFGTNWALIGRLTLNRPIGKQSNWKFLGGDWRRRERSSVIGEKENLPCYWRRGAALSVTGTAAWPLIPTPDSNWLKQNSIILQNLLA